LDWAPVFVVVDRDRLTAVVPEGSGIEAMPDVEIAAFAGGPLYSPAVSRPAALAVLATVLSECGLRPGRFGCERERFALADLGTVPNLRDAPDIGPLLAHQRWRKDAAEIAQIRANLRVVEAGFDAARELIRPGVTEL